MTDAVSTQPCIRLIHIADYDGNVLEAQVIATEVRRGPVLLWSKILTKLQLFLT
jgi:hypothetical protein